MLTLGKQNAEGKDRFELYMPREGNCVQKMQPGDALVPILSQSSASKLSLEDWCLVNKRYLDSMFQEMLSPIRKFNDGIFCATVDIESLKCDLLFYIYHTSSNKYSTYNFLK